MRSAPHLITIVLILVLAVSGFAGCAGKSSSGQFDDLTITARVKTALLNDPEVTAPRIDVETVKGVVTLSGRVASKQEEQKAIKVARSIAGVVDVRSTLQIQQ
jgi:hyperosmotically inducible periplasmic protein